MAVIDYTRRQAAHRNLGEVRRAEKPDASALSSAVALARSQEHLAATGAHIGRRLADVGADFGRAAISLSALLGRREEERELAKAAGMIIAQNERDLLSADRDAHGMPSGFLNRIGEDCRGLVGAGQSKLRETLEAVGEELGFDDDKMDLLRLKMSPYARSCENRLLKRETDETLRVQVAEAEALWKNEVAAIAGGNNTEEMYRETIGDFEHYLDVAGVTGEPRAAQTDAFLRSLVKGDVESAIAGFRSVGEFDAALGEAKADPSALFMGNKVLQERLGAMPDDLREELERKLADERDRFAGREQRRKMAEAAELKEGFQQKELEMMGKGLPPTEYVAFYRECGSDEALKAASPETALQYMNHADRLEKAIKKGECDQTEESLSLRLTDLMVREANGDAELNGGKIASEQAAIWRDYQAALHAGKLGEGFANSFLNRLANRLTDEERNAMREFYAAFGWHGDLNREGEPSAKDRKDWAKEKVLAPVDETLPMTSEVASGRKLTGAQMFELGDTFLRQLRTMGPEAYRGEVMKTMIREMKARHMASRFGENRDELAWKMLNIQRNLNAGAMQNERSDAGNDAVHGGARGPELSGTRKDGRDEEEGAGSR